jgi:hypothetical protein
MPAQSASGCSALGHAQAGQHEHAEERPHGEERPRAERGTELRRVEHLEHAAACSAGGSKSACTSAARSARAAVCACVRSTRACSAARALRAAARGGVRRRAGRGHAALRGPRNHYDCHRCCRRSAEGGVLLISNGPDVDVAGRTEGSGLPRACLDAPEQLESNCVTGTTSARRTRASYIKRGGLAERRAAKGKEPVRMARRTWWEIWIRRTRCIGRGRVAAGAVAGAVARRAGDTACARAAISVGVVNEVCTVTGAFAWRADETACTRALGTAKVVNKVGTVDEGKRAR